LAKLKKITEEEEKTFEYDDDAEDTGYQAEDIDDFSEDISEAKPVEGPFPSFNISYKALLYIFIGLVSLSLATGISMTALISRKVSRLERETQEKLHQIELALVAGASKKQEPYVCESCKSKEGTKKETTSTTMDEWIGFLEAKRKEDNQNQNVPRRNRPIELGQICQHDIYKVRKDLSGQIIDVRKEGSYIR